MEASTPTPADWLSKPLHFVTNCQHRHPFLIFSMSLVSIPANTSSQGTKINISDSIFTFLSEFFRVIN